MRELDQLGGWRLDAIQGPPGREPVPFTPGEPNHDPRPGGEQPVDEARD
mgnify:FL=1